MTRDAERETMRQLGKTGVRVSRLALGTMAFGSEADETWIAVYPSSRRKAPIAPPVPSSSSLIGMSFPVIRLA